MAVLLLLPLRYTSHYRDADGYLYSCLSRKSQVLTSSGVEDCSAFVVIERHILVNTPTKRNIVLSAVIVLISSGMENEFAVLTIEIHPLFEHRRRKMACSRRPFVLLSSDMNNVLAPLTTERHRILNHVCYATPLRLHIFGISQKMIECNSGSVSHTLSLSL
jgi:hypothetical protein